MIGREREREMLRSAVGRAAAGGSAFPLVIGAPGIGKTTLLRALSDLAADAGLIVGYARGEPDRVAPLSPWTASVRAIDAQRCRPQSSPVSLHDRLAEPRSVLDVGAERFADFERFAGDLSVRAADGPIALVVDDLHWADVSTLRLFRHLLDQPSLPGVLVAAGLRTTEPLAHDEAEVISGLLAHPSTEVVEISAFGAREITAFAGEKLARQPSDDEIAVLTQRSGGNPFLLGELLRWIPADGSGVALDAVLPLAVRESVRRRLVVEDTATQQVVKAAAVAGSVLSLDQLASITGIDRVEAANAIDSAHRAGLLVAEPDRCCSVSFVHELVRQAVLSLLPTWGRVQLHHAVGMALLDGVRTSSWAAVASHLTAARPLVDEMMLASVARHASVEAARAGAFDEAAHHLGIALDSTDAAGDTTERGELLLEQGRALWAAERGADSNAVLMEAAEWARRNGDADLLARVALSWRGGESRAIFRRPDHQFLSLLREALATCASGDSWLHCMLLARLAMCATWDIDDREALAACDEAVAMARRLRGAEELISALGTRFYYCWRPELAHERLTVADEMVAVAATADDTGLIAQASYFRLVALLELGRLRDAWSELDRFEGAVAACGQPLLRVRALWFRATRHLASGERLQAEVVADQACQLAARMGRPDAAVEQLGQSLMLLAAEGRVDDALQLFSPGLLHPVTYNSVAALAHGFAGCPVEAAAALRDVVAAGLERHPRDTDWMFGRCGLLVAAVVAADTGIGQRMFDDLEPFAGQWVVLNPGIMVIGAVDHYLGLCAALLGRTDDAVDHLRAAAAADEREDAVALALLSLHELSAVLAQRGQPCDDTEAASIERRIARLAARNTVPYKPLLDVMWSGAEKRQQPHRQRLMLEGDTWLVEFGGSGARFRDQRGLHHLRTLLERPGMEIPALMLAGRAQGLAGSSEASILDDRALRDYRQHIADLRDDIDEATSNNDIERSAKANWELDILVEQLTAAAGTRGRARQFTGADERARVSVTKAIRAAINHLGEQLPELGRHLRATVHTGGRCVYQPDPRAAERWKTERM